MKRKVTTLLLSAVMALSLMVGAMAAIDYSVSEEEAPEVEATIDTEQQDALENLDSSVASEVQSAEPSTQSIDALSESDKAEDRAVAAAMSALQTAATGTTTTSDALNTFASSMAQALNADVEAAKESISNALASALEGTGISASGLNISSVSSISLGISEKAEKALKNSDDPNAAVLVEIKDKALEGLPDNAVIVVLQVVDGKWVDVPVKVVNGKVVGQFKSSGAFVVLTKDKTVASAEIALLHASNKPSTELSVANGGIVTSPQTGDVHFEGALALGAVASGMALAYSLKRRETV